MKTFIQKRIADIKAAKLTKGRERKYIAQLERRGWSDMDVWGLNTHLANYMLPMVKLLFKNPQGHPCDLKSLKAWKAIGAKITWSLERYATDDFFELAEKATGYHPGKTNDEKLRKRWSAKNRELSLQAQEGMHLFGIYFCNFWD